MNYLVKFQDNATDQQVENFLEELNLNDKIISKNLKKVLLQIGKNDWGYLVAQLNRSHHVQTVEEV